MSRVVHHRIWGLDSESAAAVQERLARLVQGRAWRSEPPWLASDSSTSLFEMEYFRHLRVAEGTDVSAGGFLKTAGDEIDVLVLTLFLRDVSVAPGIKVSIRDDDNPIAKLRRLELHGGLLADGRTLEQTLARRPVVKKVMGQAILFYPPTYKLHEEAPDPHGQWGYALCGLRAFAPTLLEAEEEALKILRGLRHLGR